MLEVEEVGEYVEEDHGSVLDTEVPFPVYSEVVVEVEDVELVVEVEELYGVNVVKVLLPADVELNIVVEVEDVEDVEEELLVELVDSDFSSASAFIA